MSILTIRAVTSLQALPNATCHTFSILGYYGILEMWTTMDYLVPHSIDIGIRANDLRVSGAVQCLTDPERPARERSPLTCFFWAIPLAVLTDVTAVCHSIRSSPPKYKPAGDLAWPPRFRIRKPSGCWNQS